MKPSILITLDLSDGERTRRVSYHVTGDSPHDWPGQFSSGAGYCRYDSEEEARAGVAKVLRQWADQIERTPLRSPSKGALRYVKEEA